MLSSSSPPTSRGLGAKAIQSQQGNGDVDDAYDSEEVVDMTQRYPEDHDYKDLAGMFFIQNKP